MAPTTARADISTAAFVERIVLEPPRLGWRPALRGAEFLRWRGRVRARLRALLGLGGATPPLRAVMQSCTPREGYRVERWLLDPEPGWSVPILMLVPDSARAAPAPAVLCFPGTDHSKELLAGEEELPGAAARYHKYPAHPDRERMGLHYVRAGFVVLCVDNPGTQETWDPRCPGRTELSQHLILAGRSYFSLGVRLALQARRWIAARPSVDRRRIAVSGFSLGTNPALMSAVLDPAVGAVVHCGHLGAQRDRVIALGLCSEKMWQIVPGMAAWFDKPDLAAALAPRPLLICEGTAPWHARRLRAAYTRCAAAERLRIVWNPAFASASGRRHSARFTEPPRGITEEQFKRVIAQDSPNHGFKPEIAVPWLMRAMCHRRPKT